MMVGLFPSFPGSLNEVLIDVDLNLDCHRSVDVVVDGSPLAKVFKVLMTLWVVICSSRPARS